MNDDFDYMKRIEELEAKKNSLKSKRLGKKESDELRNLVNDNARCFMISCWSKEEIERVNKVLRDNDIGFERFKMPEKVDLRFF